MKGFVQYSVIIVFFVVVLTENHRETAHHTILCFQSLFKLLEKDTVQLMSNTVSHSIFASANFDTHLVLDES